MLLASQRVRTPHLMLFLLLVLISGVVAEELPERTSSFNEQWLDAVISIEQWVPPERRREKIHGKGGEYESIGTGFLVETGRKHAVLVTGKHVITTATGSARRDLGYRVNERDGSRAAVISDNMLQQQGAGPWFLHESHDLACRFFGVRPTSQYATIPFDMMLAQRNVQAGAPILVLGFPMGMRSLGFGRPIVRGGIIARSDLNAIMADVFVFPGNSGGPVIYVPTLRFGKGFQSTLLNEERLIGVVASYTPYVDRAISPQTGRTRISFEENSGLADVVPADALLRLLNREDVRAFDEALQSRSSSQ